MSRRKRLIVEYDLNNPIDVKAKLAKIIRGVKFRIIDPEEALPEIRWLRKRLRKLTK